MGAIVKLKEPPEPIVLNGRPRLVSGWNTAAVCQWLIDKKLGEHWPSISELAVFAYGRDSQSNRAKARNNIRAVRRALAERGEFLLTRHGYQQTTTELKVCNPADIDDRNVASKQLDSLVARCEITEAERDRWERMLYLPTLEFSRPRGSVALD